MKIEGILKVIDETKDVGSSGFQKRDCVVTTKEQYPQHILVQFVQDKCNLLTGFNVGEEVNIDINLRGREWINPQGESRYFNSIQGWRIEKLSDVPTSAVDKYNNNQDENKFEPNTEFKEEDHDDLPF